MLRYIIYYSSYLFMLYVFFRLSMDRKRTAADVVFLVGVALVPLGKLFYIPFTGLVSVTMGFVFTTMASCLTMLIVFIRGVERFAFVPFIILLPAFFSIIFLYGPSQSGFVTAMANASSAGSPLIRILSVFFTCIYCSYVLVYVSRNENGRKDLANYFVLGTLFATFIGVFISYSLFTGALGPQDIMPVSVEDVHLAGRIYRFNPGSSVNEFGEKIGYAIFMLRWTGWQNKRKMAAAGVLLIALFFSLTRGAWLGMVTGFVAYTMFAPKSQRTQIFVAAGCLMAFLLVIIASSAELSYLLASRTSFQNSPGSDDRLNTAYAIFAALEASPLRMLFGFGWAADIFSGNYGFEKVGYIHSVPLMFLFDTGIIGVLICAALFVVMGRFVYANVRKDIDIIAGIVVFMFTVSAVEHLFFHVQTWLMFGLIMGIALRASRENAAVRRQALTGQPQPAS